MKTSYPRKDIRVLLLEGVSPSAVDVFRDAGYSGIEVHAGSLSGDELRERIREAHIVGIRSRTQLTAEVLGEARRLMAVGCFCIGTNQVDLQAAAAAPASRCSTRPTPTPAAWPSWCWPRSILLMRGVPAAPRRVPCAAAGSKIGRRQPRSARQDPGHRRLRPHRHPGRTAGRGDSGMRVLFHDIESKLSLGNARAAAGLDDLLARADVVTLHVPETPATRMMIGATELAAMKPGVHLINASRGTVVDIDALAAALESGHVGGAAIDVFPVEPKGNDEPFQSPLTRFDNVLLTPHVGGSTLEAQDNIGREVASKLVRYSDNGSTLSAVNFPEVTLPGHEGSQRILHIHRNVPGVLSRVNEVFSQAGLNIDGQYLRTDPDVGYVVIDVGASAEQAQALRAQLAAIPDTLRTRVLY